MGGDRGGGVMSKFHHYSPSDPCPICGGKDCRSQNDGNLLVYCYTLDGSQDAPGFKFIGESSGSSSYKWVQISERSEAERTAAAEKAAAKRATEAERIANNATEPERDKRYRFAYSQLGLKPAHAEKLADRGFTREQSARWLHHSENAYDGFGIVAPIFNEQGQAIGAQIRRDTLPKDQKNRYRWHEGQGKQKLPDLAELPLAWCEPEQVTHTALVIGEGTSFKPQLISQSLGAIVVGAAGGNFTACSQQFTRYLNHARIRFGLSRIELAADSGSVRNGKIVRHYRRAIEAAEALGFECRVIWYGQTLKKSEGGKDCDEITAAELAAADRISWKAFEDIAIKYGGLPVSVPPKPVTPKPLPPKPEIISAQWQSTRAEAATVITIDREFAEAAAAQNQSVILVAGLDKCIAGKHPNRTIAAEVAAALPAAKSRIIIAIESDDREQCQRVKNLAWCLRKADYLVSIAYQSEAIELAKSFDLWRGLQLGKLSRKPDQIVTREQLIDGKYLPNISVPSGCKLLATKGHHGGGKTEQYKYQAEDRRRSSGVFLPVMYLTHRVALSTTGGLRLGVDHSDVFAVSGVNPATMGYSLCLDSLKSEDFRGSQSIFKVEDWHDAIVVIDEIEQVLQHLLFSDTLRSKRIEIMGNFAQLIRNVAASQHGLILIGDADLSDVSIALFKALSGGLLTDENIHIVEAEVPERAARVAYIYENPESLLSDLENAILAGEKVIIHTSAQKASSKWSSLNAEKYLLDKFAGLGLRIIRIDSDTVKTPDHAAYGGVAKINQICANHDVIIASPVIETGVSIDEAGTLPEDRIDSVWSFASGLQAEQSARQTIERVRSDIPRHIFAPTGTGLGQHGNGSVNPWFVAIGETNKAAAADTLAGYRAAAEADSAEDLKAYTEAWTKYAAYLNSGKKDYRAAITRGLRASGYTIIEAAPLPKPEKTEIKEAIEQIRDSSWDAKNAAVSAEIEIDDDDAYRLEKKDQRTPAEDLRLRKWKLTRRYAIESDDVSPALDRADDEGCYSKLQLHYWLTVGREQLPERDEMRRYNRRNRDAIAWLPDANRELLKGKIEALELLGIPELIEAIQAEPGATWHKFSPELVALRERFIIDRNRLGDVLGCEISGKSLDNPLAIARSILGKVGISFESPSDASTPKQVRIGGDRVRQYFARFDFAEVFDRSEQFDRWHAAEAERIAEWHADRAEAERIQAEAAEAERIATAEAEPEPPPMLSKAEALALMIEDQRRRRRPGEALDRWIERCADKFGDASIIGDAFLALAEANLIAA
jgi:hypothetical protein